MELLKPNSEKLYGKIIFESREEKSKFKSGAAIIIVPAIFMLAMGVAMLINPNIFGSYTFPTAWPYILMALGIAALSVAAWGRSIGKQHNADVFEHGLVVENNKKITSFDFSELESISYLGGWMPYRGKPASFGAIRHLTIIPKSEKNNIIDIAPFKLNDFNAFADVVTIAHTYYILKDVKKENIDNLCISFGEVLKLTNGKLVYNEGEKEIPIEDIVEMFVDYPSKTLALYGEREKLLSVELKKLTNQTILLYLVGLLQNDKKLSIKATYKKVVEMLRIEEQHTKKR